MAVVSMVLYWVTGKCGLTRSSRYLKYAVLVKKSQGEIYTLNRTVPEICSLTRRQVQVQQILMRIQVKIDWTSLNNTYLLIVVCIF